MQDLQKHENMNNVTYTLNRTHDTKHFYFLYDNYLLQKQGSIEGDLTPNLIMFIVLIILMAPFLSFFLSFFWPVHINY